MAVINPLSRQDDYSPLVNLKLGGGPLDILFFPTGFLANVGVLQALPYYVATTDFVAN